MDMIILADTTGESEAIMADLLIDHHDFMAARPDSHQVAMDGLLIDRTKAWARRRGGARLAKVRGAIQRWPHG